MICPAPRTYRKHQRTPKIPAASLANNRCSSPLKYIQNRTRPSSRLISSSAGSSSGLALFSRTALAHPISLGVVDFEFADEGSFLFDLGAVADDYDLHVGGIQILPGRREQVFRPQRADFLAIRFEIIVGQFVERHGGKLREQAILSGEPHRENSA